MALIDENDKFIQYRYKVDEFKVLSGGDTITVEPFQIVDMSIENNYEEDLFPIFKVSLSIDPSTYYSILKNKNDVKFKIRIQKYSKEVLSEKKSLYTDVINDTFSMFLEDSDVQFDEDLYNKRRETEGLKKGEVALAELSNTVEFFLFKESYVNNIKTETNKIISSANLTTAVSWLLSQGGLGGGLMSPMDNRRIYSPLVIPPLNIIDAIAYLDNNYGFYKNGALIYFGLDHPYILNYKGGCTAWKSSEWKETMILVLDRTNENNRLSSSLIKPGEERYYINIQDEHVNIMNNSIINNVTQGTDAYVIDADGDSMSKQSSGASVKGKNISRTIINDTENSYLGSIYTAQQNANSIVIEISMADFNIDCIAPNKQFSFIFEKSKLTQDYKGIYRIASSFLRFMKDGDDFSVESSCSFKKV